MSLSAKCDSCQSERQLWTCVWHELTLWMTTPDKSAFRTKARTDLLLTVCLIRVSAFSLMPLDSRERVFPTPPHRPHVSTAKTFKHYNSHISRNLDVCGPTDPVCIHSYLSARKSLISSSIQEVVPPIAQKSEKIWVSHFHDPHSFT